MIKFTAVLFGVMSLFLLDGKDMELPFSREPVISFTDGNIYKPAGKGILITKDQALRNEKGMLKFDGKESFLKLTIPWQFREQTRSVTMVIDFTLDSYDTRNGVLAGCHVRNHVLRIRNDGKLVFGRFSPDGQPEKYVVSRKKLELGRLYRAVGVLDLSAGNRWGYSLYLDGELQGSVVLPSQPFLSRNEVCIGGIAVRKDGSVKFPLPCSVKNFYFFL